MTLKLTPPTCWFLRPSTSLVPFAQVLGLWIPATVGHDQCKIRSDAADGPGHAPNAESLALGRVPGDRRMRPNSGLAPVAAPHPVHFVDRNTPSNDDPARESTCNVYNRLPRFALSIRRGSVRTALHGIQPWRSVSHGQALASLTHQR